MAALRVVLKTLTSTFSIYNGNPARCIRIVFPVTFVVYPRSATEAKGGAEVNLKAKPGERPFFKKEKFRSEAQSPFSRKGEARSQENVKPEKVTMGKCFSK